MTQPLTSSVILLGALTLVIAASVLLVFMQRGEAASPFPPTTVATTTINNTVTSGAVELLFATTTSCTSRTIGTKGEVTLTFSDLRGDRPSATTGFPQAASTTVTYDSGLVGCGAVFVYPLYSGAISVQETY